MLAKLLTLAKITALCTRIDIRLRCALHLKFNNKNSSGVWDVYSSGTRWQVNKGRLLSQGLLYHLFGNNSKMDATPHLTLTAPSRLLYRKKLIRLGYLSKYQTIRHKHTTSQHPHGPTRVLFKYGQSPTRSLVPHTRITEKDQEIETNYPSLRSASIFRE